MLKGENGMKQKRRYEEPKAEKLEFDYTKAVVASGVGGKCMIIGTGASWSNTENACSTSVAGD